MKFKHALICIVILGFLFRLHRLTTPLADWHSFRQADTASVTREFVKHGIDLLHPKYQDLGNIQSGTRTGGKDNVDGWRMVEFPLMNGLIAIFLRTFPTLDLVVTSRLFSIFASLCTIIALAYLGKNIHSRAVGLLSALFFAVVPYTVFYSRTILPEPYLVASVTVSLALFSQYVREVRGYRRYLWLLLSACVFSVALLLKPMAIFYVPAYVGVVLVLQGARGLFDPAVIVLFATSVVPLYFWRTWIEQFPSGIPASDWLFNGDGIRLRPAWFRWLFWERLTKMFLGFTGTIIFAVGGMRLLYDVFEDYRKESSHPKTLLQKRWSMGVFGLLWGAGMTAYLIVIATGNVRHDYYQYLLTPFLSFVLAYGTYLIWMSKKTLLRSGLVLTLMVGWYFSWGAIKGFYNINHPEIMIAGEAVDRLVPESAKVIAPYMSDTAFLFQTNRTGWPIGGDIEKKISEGASYYVSVNYDDEARELEKKYETVEKTTDYILLDLRKEKAKGKS